MHEDFDRHPIYVELYNEVKQNEDLERHRSMSKKVGRHADVQEFYPCHLMMVAVACLNGVVRAVEACAFLEKSVCASIAKHKDWQVQVALFACNCHGHP